MVVVRPGLVWVADGVRGVGTVRLEEGAPRYSPGVHVGRVVDLEAAPGGALALTAEGSLVRLEATDDGAPRVAASLVFDGRGRDLDVAVGREPGHARWALAAGAGGGYAGALAADGELVITQRREDLGQAWHVVVGDGEAVWMADAARTLWSLSGDAQQTLPARCAVSAGEANVIWFACGAAGVWSSSGGEPSARRVREGAAARAVAALPGGDALVSWSDARVERVGPGGAVRNEWSAGAAGRVLRVATGAWAVQRELPAQVEVYAVGGRTMLEVPGELGELWATEGADWAAIRGGGLHRVDAAGARQVRSDSATSVAVAGDGAVFISQPGVALATVDPVSGDLEQLLADPSRNSEDCFVAASDRWAVTTVWRRSLLFARSRDPAAPQSVEVALNGPPEAVILRGEVAVVGIRGWGVDVVPLDQGPRPAVRTVRLPMPAWGSRRAGRVCKTRSGVLVTLGEVGVARVTIDGATPRLEAVLETPGWASDCAATSTPGRYLVADRTGLVELVLSP